jgi:hypothetical protein
MLIERPVWPVSVVVVDVGAKDAFEVASVDNQYPVEAPAADPADESFSKAFAFGARTGVRTVWDAFAYGRRRRRRS